MKRIVLITTLILILISEAICIVYAQENHVISDSIYSNILKEERSIKIQLPESYNPGSDDKYGVIYVTDGEWAMNLFSFIYKFAQDENYVPPAIIVAIPNKYINNKNQRGRDFLPVDVSGQAKSVGAGNFLSFIKNELIPYINNKYPTNGTNSIYGHSYGGVFVLYTLLTEPQLFKAYYTSDAPFSWNKDYLIKMAGRKLKNLPAGKFFWGAGREQDYKEQGTGRLDSLLKLKAPKGLHWKMVVYKNETHNSVRLKAIYDGLKFVYSGYGKNPLVFNPMNGILLKNKPITIYIANENKYPELRYTVDGTEPNLTSPKVGQNFTITGPAKLVVKSFSSSGNYDKTARGNFELGKVMPPVSKPEKIVQGGIKYSYYEGSWEKLPDFKKLKPFKTGIADSTFNFNELPRRFNFACLFKGYIKIVRKGYYIFGFISQGGYKLYFGDKLIIDNDSVHSDVNGKSFILPLEKGFYPVRIEYFQKDESNGFKLLYMNPGSMRHPVSIPFKYQCYKE